MGESSLSWAVRSRSQCPLHSWGCPLHSWECPITSGGVPSHLGSVPSTAVGVLFTSGGVPSHLGVSPSQLSVPITAECPHHIWGCPHHFWGCPLHIWGCLHGKPVPAGLSPLSPHSFSRGAGAGGGSSTSCHRGLGGSGSNSWEASENQARAQLTEEILGNKAFPFSSSRNQGNVS